MQPNQPQRESALSRLLRRLEGTKLAPLVQFIKFGLVGVSNTLINYAIEMLCYYVLFRNAEFTGTVGLLQGLGITATGEAVRIAVTNLLAFVVSVVNSYYWNSRFVFQHGEQGRGAGRFFKTVACYAVTGLLLAPWLKGWLSSGAVGLPYWLASIATLAVTIPLNFVLNKLWAFRDKT